jgi:hypothetical protein
MVERNEIKSTKQYPMKIKTNTTVRLIAAAAVAICVIANASTVWVAKTPTGKLIGIYSSYEQSAQACTTTNDFVFAVELNRNYGTNHIETGALFPLR